MKLLRTSAPLLAFITIALLAACGGGGGGGSVNPPGGGGGGTPPPTSTPSPAPTSTPTAPPTATPTPSTVQSNGSIAKIYDGTTSPVVFGHDNWQTNGLSALPDAGDGDVAGGYSTPTNSSSTIDGVTCALASEGSVTGKYHVHTFLGIYVNGTQYAIPDAIGMQNPTTDEPVSGFTNACPIHTHAPSGIIHIEDPSMAQNFATQPAQYNLQSLLDIWGQGSFSNIATAAAGFSGPVSIYLGTPCPNNAVTCANPTKNGTDDLVTSYTLQTASPPNILLGHHVAIWVIVGSLPAGGLPAIDFNIEN